MQSDIRRYASRAVGIGFTIVGLLLIAAGWIGLRGPYPQGNESGTNIGPFLFGLVLVAIGIREFIHKRSGPGH